MHGISISVLSSGSIGNSILVSGGGSCLLVDAGISCRDLERRLSSIGIDATQIDAVVLTHEHTDHTRGARRFCSQYQKPIIGTRGTLALVPSDGAARREISAKEPFEIGGMIVTPFRVRHLAADPIAVTISTGSKKVGIASDLGSITSSVIAHMSGCGLMLVEANYDDEMLRTGDYPEFLKRTIKSDHGHLSNHDASMLVSKAVSKTTCKVVLIHLSKENNTPEKARQAVDEGLGKSTSRPVIEVSEHGCSSGPHLLR